LGGWGGLALSPDGSVYTVGYDYEPYSGAIVAQTRIGVIGADGKPAPGWPIALEGAASPPAFGPDGTIYVARAGLGTAPSQVIAYDRSGQVKPGWPVSLPKGLGTLSGDGSGTPSAPVAGNDGEVFVAAIDSRLGGQIIGYDSSGSILPGSPYSLPVAFGSVSSPYKGGQSPGPMFVKSADGRGALYMLLDGEIVAIGPDGGAKKGWPYRPPGWVSGQSYWLTWAASPDGGLVAVSVTSADVVQTATIVHLAPDGTLAH
jgi:hypothetical protein